MGRGKGGRYFSGQMLTMQWWHLNSHLHSSLHALSSIYMKSLIFVSRIDIISASNCGVPCLLGSLSLPGWRLSTLASDTGALYSTLLASGMLGSGALLGHSSNPTGVVPPALLFWQATLRPSKLCSAALLLKVAIFQNPQISQIPKSTISRSKPWL